MSRRMRVREGKTARVADECAACSGPIAVPARAWEGMGSDEGLEATANYCGPACRAAGERRPRQVVATLRARQARWVCPDPSEHPGESCEEAP